MNKLGLLLKTYFKIYLGSFGKRKLNAKISGTTIVLLMSCLFIFLFSSMAYSSIYQAVLIGAPEVAMYSIVTVALLFTMLLVVLKGTNQNKHQDAEILLSLPIKKSVIVLSKILHDFIFDLAMVAVCIYPGVVCYYLLVDSATILVLFNGLFIVIFLTMFSNALAILIKSIILKITRRLKHAEIFQTLFNVIIAITFIVLYYAVNLTMTDPNSGFVDALLNFKPLALIVSAIINNDFISLLIVFIFCLIPFLLAMVLAVKGFNKTNKTYKAINKELVFKKNLIFVSLFKRESSRYFRSTNYVLNTIIGAFFIVLFAGMMLGFGDTFVALILNQVKMNNIASKIPFIIVLVMVFLSSTVVTTASAISLEGKQFWILKANPINPIEIFKAKILLNLAISFSAIFIGSLLLTIYLGISFLPFILLISMLAAVFASVNGLLCDLKYCKLDWKHETEVIKQGLNVLVSLATAGLPALILFIIYMIVGINLNGFLYLGICLMVFIIIDFIMIKILTTKGVKMFNEIIE